MHARKLGNLSSAKVSLAVIFTQFSQNSEDILSEWQTAWNLIRCRVTRRLAGFQDVCKGYQVCIQHSRFKGLTFDNRQLPSIVEQFLIKPDRLLKNYQRSFLSTFGIHVYD